MSKGQLSFKLSSSSNTRSECGSTHSHWFVMASAGEGGPMATRVSATEWLTRHTGVLHATFPKTLMYSDYVCPVIMHKQLIQEGSDVYIHALCLNNNRRYSASICFSVLNSPLLLLSMATSLSLKHGIKCLHNSLGNQHLDSWHCLVFSENENQTKEVALLW